MERGTVKTSAIVIATGERTSVYRTLEEVPGPLRKRLIRSTGGMNAGTVLIADRRGAEELLRGQGEAPGEAKAEAGLARRLRGCCAAGLRVLAAHYTELALSGALALLLWLVFAARR